MISGAVALGIFCIQIVIVLLFASFFTTLYRRERMSPQMEVNRSLPFLISAYIFWLGISLTRVIDTSTDLRLWMQAFGYAVSDCFLILAATQLDFAPKQIRCQKFPRWPAMVCVSILFIQAGLYAASVSGKWLIWRVPGVLFTIFAGMILTWSIISTLRKYDFFEGVTGGIMLMFVFVITYSWVGLNIFEILPKFNLGGYTMISMIFMGLVFTVLNVARYLYLASHSVPRMGLWGSWSMTYRQLDTQNPTMPIR